MLQGEMTVSRDTESMINARIAQIDHLLSIQLNEVLHHPTFQKLEGSWRGLKYMLDQSETSDMLKIKVLNCSKKELLRDLQRAPEFDQSALFKKVYEEEFGVFGGAPFGALMGDYEFGKGPGGPGTAGEDLQCGFGRACAVPYCGVARAVQYGKLHQPGRTARHRQDLRHHRVRQVEIVPAVGGFAVRRVDLAAHSDAPALREG